MSSPFTTPPYEDAFSNEDTEFLEQERIFLQPLAGGKRKVSAIVLSPPHSYGSTSSLASSPTASVRRMSFSSSNLSSFDMPLSAYSTAALEFIGFGPQSAREIFNRFNSRPNPDINPDDLLDYARGYIDQKDPQEEMPENEAMARMGLTQQVQSAIMSPAFTDIRRTQSLHYWVYDTIRINYATLICLQTQLKSAADRIRGKKNPERASMPHVRTLFSGSTASSSQGQVQEQTQHPETTATMSMLSDERNLPASWIALVEKSRPALPDHYVLYKCKAASEMGDWIREDGSLEMAGLQTYPGGDFNHRNPASYWTLEEETAEQYRAFVATRCPYSETWMIQIQVPKSFIRTLEKEDLYYSRDWKEYIWHCKKEIMPPEQYAKYWRQVDLINGHICTGITGKITRIKKHEVPENINESFVLTMPSNPSFRATQWVFVQERSVEQLCREIRGKIHIDVTAPSMSTQK